VDHDGVFNTVSMAGSTEEQWFTDWEFGGTTYANRALYEKWSPLNFVGNWTDADAGSCIRSSTFRGRPV